MPNLSSLLEGSAAGPPGPYGGRAGRHPPDLRPGRRRRQPGRQPAGLARHRAGRQGRAELPEPAVLPDRLLRHPQGRRRPSCRSTCCSRDARWPTTSTTRTRRRTSASRARPELPIGAEGHAGFEQTDGVRALLRHHRRPGRGRRRSRAPRRSARRSRASRRSSRRVEVGADDTAVILYTSGTTGQPKGAELMHRNMISNALASDALFGADADNPDTLLCVLPLFHSFGQTVIMNAGFAFGGTVVLLPRFEAGPALTLMEQEGVTFFAGVPTMYWGLLGALDDSGVDVKKLADHAAGRGRRRLGAAGRGAQGVRAPLRRHDPRGLRPLRDLAGRELLGVGRARARRLDRQADPRRRDEADQPRARRARGRRGRRGRRSARSRSRAPTS